MPSYGPTPKRGWDEYTPTASHRTSKWASTARGWLFDGKAEASLGNYLDYGPCDIYRSPEDRAAQPGDVHALVYASKDDGRTVSRWCETVEDARSWIELESGFTTIQQLIIEGL